MFLFYWCDVFESAYRNGLADGVSLFLIAYCIKACYAWSQKCEYFRYELNAFLRELKRRTDTKEELVSFRRFINRNWCLDKQTKREILTFLDELDPYTGQLGQTRSREKQSIIDRFIAYGNNLDTSAFAMFCKNSVKTIFVSLIFAEWYNKD